MAGQASEDDAVSVNVTPLIDIILRLCIFICSFHFKQLQGSLSSWLPKDRGNQGGGATTATMEDIDVRIYKNGAARPSSPTARTSWACSRRTTRRIARSSTPSRPR